MFGVQTWENILKAVIKIRSWKWSHRASALSCTSLDGGIGRPPEIPYWWRHLHKWWSESLETPTPCPLSSHDMWPCAPLPLRCQQNRMRNPQSMKWTSPVQPPKTTKIWGLFYDWGSQNHNVFAFEMTNSWGQEIFMKVDHKQPFFRWQLGVGFCFIQSGGNQNHCKIAPEKGLGAQDIQNRIGKKDEMFWNQKQVSKSSV